MNLFKQYYHRFIYRNKVQSTFKKYTKDPSKKQQIVDNFHKLFYDSHIMGNTWNESKFLGTLIQKCPFDLFVYQEILRDTKPDIIIETGTAYGGSAYYMATVCDQLKRGEIYTIDVKVYGTPPKHKRIHYISGSSTDPEIIALIKKKIKSKNRVMVILDSDHSAKHVRKELDVYANLVTKGNYLIVEDTNVNGNPVFPGHGPGPAEALQEFLEGNANYAVDLDREKFLLTFNPGGFLKKIK